jgi:hypothetical protein
MSLSDVKLESWMLPGLYKNNLVLGPEQDKVANSSGAEPGKSSIPGMPSDIKYLGNNQQRITILVKNSSEVFLADEELSLLTKMITACKLTLADIAIVNIAQTPAVISSIHEFLQPQKVLMLGVDSQDIQLPMSFPEYRVQPHGPCTYLMAPPLSLMTSESDQARNIKSQLWTALKQLFGL